MILQKKNRLDIQTKLLEKEPNTWMVASNYNLINTEKKASLTYRGAVYSRTKKELKNINYWGEGTNLSKSKNDLSTSNQETNLGHTLIGCFAIVIGILIPPLGIILLGLAIFGYIIEETKSGMSFSYDNYTGLKNYIYECFIDYQQGVENIKMNNKEFLSSNIAIKIDKIISKL